MKITAVEQHAIRTVVDLGRIFGYGNLISHLNTAWARKLMESGVSEKVARLSTLGDGMPFLMQDDLMERGEWDETGERYRRPKPGERQKKSESRKG